MCTGEYRWRAGRGRDVHSHSRRLSPWSFEGIYHAGSQAMKRRYREHGAHATPPSSGSRAWETGEGAQQRMHRNGLFCPFVSGSFLRVLLLHCSLRGSPLHDGAHLRDIGANASGCGKPALSTATIHRAHEVSPNAIHATALGMFPAASSPPHAPQAAPSIGCGQQEPPPHGYQARGLAVDAATR